MIAAMISRSSLPRAAWKASAAPWKVVIMLAGSPISRSALRIALTASPSEAPGARLNDTVAAGNWPRWLTAIGAVCWMNWAIADNGTWPLVAVEEGR